MLFRSSRRQTPEKTTGESTSQTLTHQNTPPKHASNTHEKGRDICRIYPFFALTIEQDGHLDKAVGQQRRPLRLKRFTDHPRQQRMSEKPHPKKDGKETGRETECH